MVKQIDAHENGAERNGDFQKSTFKNLAATDTVSKRKINFQNPRSNSVTAWGRRTGLRTKAIAFVFCISILPVLGVGTLAYYIVNQSTTKEIIHTKQEQANLSAENLNNFMLRRYGDIQILSKLTFLQSRKIKEVISREQIEAQLNNYFNSENSYESIAVLDLNGNLVAESKGKSIPNQKSQDYFQAVLKTNEPYISKPLTENSQEKAKIYLAAPIKDIDTGGTIYIIRAVLPIKSLEKTLSIPQISLDNYDLIDASGKIFLSTTESHLGRDAKQEIPEWEQLRAGNQLTTRISFNNKDNGKKLVTYVPWRIVEGVPDLKWKFVLSTDTATAFAPQKQLLLEFEIITLIIAWLIGGSAATIANRLIQRILAATRVVKKLGQGNLGSRVAIEGEDELASLGSHINQMADQLQNSLRKKTAEAEQLKLFTNILSGSLNLQNISNLAVEEIRLALKTDRAVIYKFDENWQGSIIAESVLPDWPRVEAEIHDRCLKNYVEKYRQGRVQAIDNIYQANLSDCYIKQLEQFAVKANLVAPIRQNNQLLGLLIAHQCSQPRVWQQSEIDLFEQFASIVGLALERANLLEQTEQALAQAEIVSLEQRQQKEQLQLQLLQLLEHIEGACRGDLTVRAEVTTGEIGIVADFFNTIVESLQEIVTQVKSAATQVNSAVAENSQDINQLAIEALKQADSINSTLDSVDKMRLSIRAVANNAEQATVVTRIASHTAEAGGAAMDLTVENIMNLRGTIGETAKKVKRLGESSQHISRVVGLINQIAVQTNLLAINAGIEAARAGEESKGFVAIAEEVVVLAAQSSAATSEIEQVIANIQLEISEVVKAMELGTGQVVEGTRLVQNTKESLSEIFDVNRQIDELVQSISIATVSQVQTSKEVTHLMKEIARVSQMTSYSSHKVSSSLQKTVEISQKLQASVRTFKVS